MIFYAVIGEKTFYLVSYIGRLLMLWHLILRYIQPLASHDGSMTHNYDDCHRLKLGPFHFIYI